MPEEPCFRSKPECDLGRFHGLVNDREEFGREGTEVDLVAQAGAERPDSPGHVVAAPVEAPVHRLLDAAAGRLEGRGHGQGGGGHREAGAVGQETAEPEDHRAVPEAEQHREQPVGDGAADDPVQVVQPVAQDRRPGRERQDRDAEPRRRQEHRVAQQGRPRDRTAHGGIHRHPGQGDQRRHGGQGGPEGNPAQLLAFHATGPPKADHQRPGPDRHADGGDPVGDPGEEVQMPAKAGTANGLATDS